MAAAPEEDTAKRNTLTVRDNRTGKTIEIPIHDDCVDAVALRALVGEDKTPLMVYDPGYMNTAVCNSKITFIDGDKGILRYRGYDIEELAEKSNFLEVSFLLLYGELPTERQYEYFYEKVMKHTYIHEDLAQMMRQFRYDAHPMGIMVSAISAMSTFHPEANPALAGANLYVNNADLRNKQIFRLLGKMPTIAAAAYRHRIGRPYNYPADSHLSYTGNFLYMLDRLSERDYQPNPVLARALDILFILHADHELNCSTATMRQISSARSDPYTGVSGACGALYGPLHGGANEAVLHMLEEIGTVDKVPAFIEKVKAKESLLYGFGHRVYKNYDPRAKILKRTAYEIFDLLGRSPLLDVALALEKAALEDDYFISRKLYPNVDFYSGLIYRAMGFPTDYFPVLFAIPRTVGWLAHWNEMMDDPKTPLFRPRQIYSGAPQRPYTLMRERGAAKVESERINAYVSSQSKRRDSSIAKPNTPKPGETHFELPPSN